jgi:hypothetical protein
VDLAPRWLDPALVAWWWCKRILCFWRGTSSSGLWCSGGQYPCGLAASGCRRLDRHVRQAGPRGGRLVVTEGLGLADWVAGASTSTSMGPFFPPSSPIFLAATLVWLSTVSDGGSPLRRASSDSSLGWLVCSSTWLFVITVIGRGIVIWLHLLRGHLWYAWWHWVSAGTPTFVTGAFLCDCLHYGGQWWCRGELSWRKP